MNEHLILYVK